MAELIEKVARMAMSESGDFFGGGGTWKHTAYPMPPGTGPEGESCGTCKYIRQVGYRTKRYFKCGRMPLTHGEGTDIRKSSPACGKWEGSNV